MFSGCVWRCHPALFSPGGSRASRARPIRAQRGAVSALSLSSRRALLSPRRDRPGPAWLCSKSAPGKEGEVKAGRRDPAGPSQLLQASKCPARLPSATQHTGSQAVLHRLLSVPQQGLNGPHSSCRAPLGQELHLKS